MKEYIGAIECSDENDQRSLIILMKILECFRGFSKAFLMSPGFNSITFRGQFQELLLKSYITAQIQKYRKKIANGFD